MTGPVTGEDAVCNYLAARGWTILARNWSVTSGPLRGSLDIIAQSPTGQLAIVEVKTRRAGTRAPYVAPDLAQITRLRALTSKWLANADGTFASVQIDTATVTAGATPGAPATVDYRSNVA